MTLETISLAFVSVLMSVGAQLLLKLGMSSPAMKGALQSGAAAELGLAIASSGPVIGGLALYGLGALLWLFVLAKADLSQAYPLVSIGFVLTAVSGAVLLGEAVGPMRIAGIAFVMCGVVMIARS